MEPLPELYAIFQGEVATVTEYGAFIKIPGCRKQVPRHRSSSSNKSFWTEAWLLEGSGLRRKRVLKHELEQQGLVHKTHMSSCRVDKPSEIVDVGDKVWVKLIRKEMKDDKLKLSLSMKVVNQGTGKDLDPNNVSLDQDERKKRMFRDYTSQKITLEAVLNTVCKKCGCKGHFAKECFVQPGGTKYSLIPEEDEEEVAAAGYERDKKTSLADDSSKKRKKEKKKKKKHKNKQSSESDSDSSDSDSDGAQLASKRSKHSGKPSKAQKKKKKKKHKKKPRD